MGGWMAFYNTWLQNDIAVLVSHQHGVNGCMDEQTFKKFFFSEQKYICFSFTTDINVFFQHGVVAYHLNYILSMY